MRGREGAVSGTGPEDGVVHGALAYFSMNPAVPTAAPLLNQLYEMNDAASCTWPSLPDLRWLNVVEQMNPWRGGCEARGKMVSAINAKLVAKARTHQVAFGWAGGCVKSVADSTRDISVTARLNALKQSNGEMSMRTCGQRRCDRRAWAPSLPRCGWFVGDGGRRSGVYCVPQHR